MKEKDAEVKQISRTSTKQEMLEAYNSLLKQLQEKGKEDLKPQEEIEKKKAKETTTKADSLSAEGVVKGIGGLKLEIGKMLTRITDGLEEEVDKYNRVKEAIEIKEKELQEIYEIEKAAQTLAALIESQSEKRRAFELEMEEERETLNRERQMLRIEWEKEKKLHEAQTKERDAEEAKARQREKEDYVYNSKREQFLEKDKFEDERRKQEKAFHLSKEQVEQQLAKREEEIKVKEEELNQLQKKVEVFPKEIEAAVNKAVKETTEKTQLEARNKEELFKKSFEGERNVLATKIESLEKLAKEQREQISKLSQQMENAYQKMQEMAIKAVGGVSDLKSLVTSQPFAAEQSKKQSQER